MKVESAYLAQVTIKKGFTFFSSSSDMSMAENVGGVEIRENGEM